MAISTLGFLDESQFNESAFSNRLITLLGFFKPASHAPVLSINNIYRFHINSVRQSLNFTVISASLNKNLNSSPLWLNWLMDKNSGRIPPLSALRGFEAAARLGSFSRAAEEQNMTQSAISHQVKLLEDFFGQPLFRRIGRTVELTDAGKDFMKTAGRSLEMLEWGTWRLDAYLKPNSVVITTTPAFANKWLVPRFSQLQSDHPELQPWLCTTDEHADLEHSEIEIVIWRGHGDWPGLKIEKLIDDWITPVCAPSLLSKQTSESVPADLLDFRLLHDERREDWHEWFKQVGVERKNISSGFNFSDSGMLLDCAIAGHGFALGSLVLADTHIRDGSLVRPFPQAIKTKDAYYVACIEMYLRRPEVRKMWEWLIEQGTRFNDHLHAEIAHEPIAIITSDDL